MAVLLFFRRFRAGLTPETIAITLLTGLFFVLLLSPSSVFRLTFSMHSYGSADIASSLFPTPRGWGSLQRVLHSLQQLPVPENYWRIVHLSLFRLPKKLLYGILLLLLALAESPVYSRADLV